jgi:hypothetical protein
MGAAGIVKLVLLLLAGFIPWLFRFDVKEKTGRMEFGKFMFLSIVTSIIFSILIGYILAILEIFSTVLLIIFEYLIALLYLFLRFLIYRKGGAGNIRGFFVLFKERLVPPKLPEFMLHYLLFVIILVAIFLLYMKPAEYIHGGFDPGLYVNGGINLSKTGSPLFYDEIVRDLGYENSRRFLGMFTINPLGTSILNQFKGKMASQFYPGFTIWYAIAYETVGFNMFLYIQPVLALISLFGLYFFTSTVFNRSIAALAVVLYSINIIAVWFVRYPVSEILAILLLSSSLYLLLHFQSDGDIRKSVIGGAAAAAALLTRPDTALILIALGAVGIYRYLWQRWRKGESFFYVAVMIGFFASLFYALFYTGGYLRGIFVSFIGVGLYKERALARSFIIFLLLLIFIALLVFLLKRRNKITNYLKRYRGLSRFFPSLFAAVILSFIIFQFFIRPSLPFAFLSPHANSLVRLGWYFAPLGIGWDNIMSLSEPIKWLLLKGGILFALLSAVYVLEKSRDERVWLFHITWLSYAFLYFQDLRIETVHFWLNRRYLMFILFGILCCISIPLIQIWKKAKKKVLMRSVVVLIALFYVFNFSLGTKLIWDHREWIGINEKLVRFESNIPGDAMIIIDGSPPYTLNPLHLPLSVIFDRKVSTLKNSSPYLDSLPVICEELDRLYGKVVYITPDKESMSSISGYWGYIGANHIRTEVFEQPYVLDYRPPAKSKPYIFPVYMYRFLSENLLSSRAEGINIGADDDYFIAGEWYLRENEGDIFYRWTGAEAEVVVPVKMGAKVLEINLASGRPTGVPPAEVSLIIDEEKVINFTPDPRFKTYRFNIRNIRGHATRIKINTNTWKPDSYNLNDSRKLGVKVNYLRFTER